MKIHYHPKLKQRARDLRNESTLSEVLLWNQLKGRKLHGYQFMRQKPIENYIVDFYCSKLELVIEIDGVTHDDKIDRDRTRQLELKQLGLRMLRFQDSDVKTNMAGVLAIIEEYIAESKSNTTP
jgi:very-short-patch-repair endonuclease